MKKYKVIGTVAAFAVGTVLCLTELQAAARKHNLEFIKGDRYRAKADVQFKHGEVVGLEVDLDKHQMFVLEPVDKAKASPAASAPVKVDASVAKFAADNEIDLATVKGTGKKGAITKADVEKAIAEREKEPELQVGDEVEVDGRRAEVTGFAEDGTPELKFLDGDGVGGEGGGLPKE